MIEAGTLLQNRYRVVRQIGQGGMGAVYLATDERFRSTVAIKQTFFDDATLLKAFEREAILLNHLRHAALPKVSDHFSEGAGQYLVMEFIEGLDFSELLQQRNGAFPLAYVLQWADDLLDALEYLHTQNPPVVHRDIKPQNLKLTTRGKVVLLDFGLAKGAQAQTRASAADSVFGYSRNYAPLEQIQGTGTDGRSDIYSLSATLYHLLTGDPPVDALTRAGALVNNEVDPLPAAHLVHSQIPASIGKIIQKAMSQKASRRHASATELRVALRRASTDLSPHVARVTSSVDLFSQRSHVSNDATQVESLSIPGELDRSFASGKSTVQAQQISTQQRETTLVDGAYVPARTEKRHGVEHSVAFQEEHFQEPAQRRVPRQLLVGAVLGLIVVFASIPVLISRRSTSTPPGSGEQVTSPESGTDVPSVDTSTSSQGGLGTDSTNNPAASAPTPMPGYSDPASPSVPTSNATVSQPTQDGVTAGASQFAGAATASGGDGSRPTLVINEPAPSQPTGSAKTGFEDDIRQREETRRERERQAEEARRAEEVRRMEEGRREQMRREGERRPPPGAFSPPPPRGGIPPPRP